LCFYLLLFLVCFFLMFLSVITISFFHMNFYFFHMFSYFPLFSLFFHFPISCSVHTCSVPTRGHKWVLERLPHIITHQAKVHRTSPDLPGPLFQGQRCDPRDHCSPFISKWGKGVACTVYTVRKGVTCATPAVKILTPWALSFAMAASLKKVHPTCPHWIELSAYK